MLYGHKILVFCTSKIYQDKFCDYISALNEALKEQNWRLLVFCTSTDLYKDNKNNNGGHNFFNLINFDTTDAVLISEDDILDVPLKNSLICKAEEHNIPVISIGGQNNNTYNICFNEQSGFEYIVRHILENHNKTKIHFMAGTANSHQSLERLEVLKKVMAEKNLPFTDKDISYGDFWDLPTRIATQKLIDSGNLPHAIICANDTMAITAVSVLQQNGYECPDDVLVTGFDGIQAIFFSNPKITTALCDYHLLGQETARFLFQITEHKMPLCTKYVDSSLHVSESCGCKPIKPANAMNFINFLTDSYARYRGEDTSLLNISIAVQGCQNIEEVQKVLKTKFFFNMVCMVKAECVTDDTNPNISHTSSTYGDVQYMLLDSDDDSEPETRYIKTEDLIPKMQYLLDNFTIPLIFTPMNYLDQPLGYLCFYYLNYDKQNYAKVSQISSWLSNALSGYRNMQFQRTLQHRIENMYSHDALTGLYNRTGFLRIYKQIMNNPEIETITLAMCDLDNLKTINDNYTHNEGDSAIDIVGKALSSTYSDGYFCRYGGDEIIGLFPRELNEDELMLKVEDYLYKYNLSSGKPYEVSTSIGVYVSKKTSFEKMFGEADKLMYIQKMAKKRDNSRF